MQLLTKFIDERNWRKNSLEKEEVYIKTFWDLEEAKEKLRRGEILACSIKLFKLDDSYEEKKTKK